MKYIRSVKTGERYCLHCKSYKCICLPENKDAYFDPACATKVSIRSEESISAKATKFLFYKQTLPNGRVIAPHSSLVVPKGKFEYGANRPKKIINLSNDIINASFCSTKY